MDPPRPPLVLASASPRRRDLLAHHGIPFVADASGIRELIPEDRPGTPPAGIALANAIDKARTVAARHPGRWVLGCDTVVVLDGHVLGKPQDRDHARAMLSMLAGRSHEVITAVALVLGMPPNPPERQIQFAVQTRVAFKPLDPAAIDAYIEDVHVLDKAGAYAAQENGERIIASIDGSYTNVVGLPMERLLEELQRIGIAG